MENPGAILINDKLIFKDDVEIENIT